MAEAELRNWSGAVDVRSLLKEDTFQSSPFKYTVNSNRQLYTGLDGREDMVHKFRERADVMISGI